MKIKEILRTKGHSVLTITQSITVLEAVQILVEQNIGGLVVVNEDGPVGILTERDILRLTAQRPGEFDSIQVGTVMTRSLITATADDDHIELMSVMTENKIRHLPIMDGDRLAGIISIGDLLNVCRTVAEEENSQLKHYIRGT